MRLLLIYALVCERIDVVIRWRLHIIFKYSMVLDHDSLLCMQVSNANGIAGNNICDPGLAYFEKSR